MDIILLILCIIPFGFDKLYKKDTKMFIFKLVSTLFFVGFIWWVYDIVTVILGKYKTNPFK